MKQVLLAVLQVIVSVSFAFGQSTGDRRETGESTAGQSADLAESKRLSVSVVKLYNEGKYDEALPIAKQALKAAERAAGPLHQGVAEAAQNIAELYIKKKDFEEAKPYYERTMSVYEKIFGAEDIRLSPVLEKLAYLHFQQSDYAKAESLYQRALAIREKALGDKHLDVAQSLFSLADFYRFRGAYAKAEPLFERALEIRNSALGEEDIASRIAKARYSCVVHRTNSEAGMEKLRLMKQADIERQKAFNASPGDGPLIGGVVNGKAISLPKPYYPQLARNDRQSGEVLVQVLIDKTGNVIDACAAKGPNLLWGAAEEAAYKARFSSTRLSGKPVLVTGVIIYNFVAR